MPYSQKLLRNRKNAATCGSHIRSIRKQVDAQTDMAPGHRARFHDALNQLEYLLYAAVDYSDDGKMYGIAGEYEAALWGLDSRYRVMWEVDVEANNPRQAAQEVAAQYFQNHIAAGVPDTACVFYVRDMRTSVTERVDLADEA